MRRRSGAGRLARLPLPLILLTAVTAVPAMIEAAAMEWTRMTGMTGLAPQISAPVGYAAFHDLRWIFVYQPGWGTFAAEVVVVLAVRSLLNAAIIALAWPKSVPRPGFRRLLTRNGLFTAVAVAVLSPWACISVAASGTSLSWFLLGELLPVIVLAMVLARGGIVPDWWRGLPRPSTMAWMFACFVVLTIDSVVVEATPGWWSVAVAGCAGALNGLLWRILVHSVVPARPLPAKRWSLARPTWLLRAPRIAPLTIPLALVITAGAVVLATLVTGFGQGSGKQVHPALRAPASAGPRQAVLAVDGYDSSYNGSSAVTESPGLIFEHYSYRGLNGHGLPRPYTARDTHQSLDRSARMLAEQVRAMHRRTGRPVTVMVVSEGSLVARDYLARFPHSHVKALVMLSPLVRPARVYVPLAGTDSWGVATGWEIRGMLDLEHLASGAQETADEPFVRSILDNAPFYRGQMMCPVAGVRTIAFLPYASAAVAPPGPLSDVPVVEVPGLHGEIADAPRVRSDLLRFVHGGKVRPRKALGYQLIRDAAAAWDAPPLPLALVPAWHYRSGAPDASFGGPICVRPGG